MQIIPSGTQEDLKRAASALKNGHLVAFPTETVYGLGADATNSAAVARIYKVKNRPSDHPLIVHISTFLQLSIWAIDIPDFAIKLAENFWPGPMTLIVRKNPMANSIVTGGQESIGIRFPSDPICLAILNEFESLGGMGVAAPSANRFGAVSPTNALAVNEELGKYLGDNDLVVDGGQSIIGIESTIIDCTKEIPRVLRPGAITQGMIEKLGIRLNKFSSSEINVRVSGSMESHYSPEAKVIFNESAQNGDGFLAMSNTPTPTGAIRLASPRSVQEFAAQLYSALRAADKQRLKKIVILLPPDQGLGSAIIDRVKKASTRE
jgi:L-threonylcarbamoyladenylate synthase